MRKQPTSARPDGDIRLVTFEAPTLQELREEVDEWISGEAGFQPISFSHAVREQRGGNLMGAGKVSVFTGTLLVKALG